MKTLILAAIRCSLIFTAVAALSIAYPASVQAVPTTYVYTGNPFTIATGPYSTSDFVTAMVTLANPLPPNAPLTQVTPLAFSLFDGVQTITPMNASLATFDFATDGDGTITQWAVTAFTGPLSSPDSALATVNVPDQAVDVGVIQADPGTIGRNFDSPGSWVVGAVPDAASTLSLSSLSLTALGVAARQFQAGSGLTAPASNSRNAVNFSSACTT
jgi:hypothetical protein